MNLLCGVQSVLRLDTTEILLVEAKGGRSAREASAALLQLGGDRRAAEDDTDGLARRRTSNSESRRRLWALARRDRAEGDSVLGSRNCELHQRSEIDRGPRCSSPVAPAV